MVEVYDSHEQSERVKGWLRENGGAIVMGLALAFSGLFGFKQWQNWEEGKAQQASAEYELMVELLSADQLDAAVANFETLRQDFGGSPYSTLAALHMARARVESGQAELAVRLLEEAMHSAEPKPVRVIARERLARLQLDLGAPDEALRLLDGAPSNSGFESRFAELRGDIYASRGENSAAVEAYREALALQDGGLGFRPLLELKIEALTTTADGALES